MKPHMNETPNPVNYDGRRLEENGLSVERVCAIRIMEHLGVCADGEAWYEDEDEITALIIEVVDKYIESLSGCCCESN